MKLSDLKQNLENLYRSDDMDYCAFDGNIILNYWNYECALFLISCDENIIQLNMLKNIMYNMQLLKKVLKECYNIIPDKYGRYL